MKKLLLHLDIGGHGDRSTNIFGGYKRCYYGQWLLTGRYFKRWTYELNQKIPVSKY